MVTLIKKYFDIESLINEIEAYLPNFNKKHFKEALDFADIAHTGQFRKDQKTPYIIHPLEAVKILTEIHAPEDILIAAILHDVPEDTNHDINEIKQFFGEKVAFLVEGITKLSKVHYQDDMPARQVESLKKLFLHSAKDPGIILIKLADRLHNMMTLQYVKPEKQLRIAKETLEIFVPIANLLGIQSIKAKLEDLCFKYLFSSQYERLKEKINKINKKNSENLQKFIQILKEAFTQAKIEAEIEEREQSLYTIYKKLLSRGKTIDDVTDRITIRIVVKTIPLCYEALGIVHGKFIPKMDKFKDYIANPKINKYQSLHTMVFGVDGILSEIQIRTTKMDLESKYGIASNFFYVDENNKNTQSTKDARSDWVDKIVEFDKNPRSTDNFLEDLKLDIFQDRIYVFTPKGRKIDLPRGASAIDFAYTINKDLGNKAVKAEINNNIMPITSTLKNGDVVNVIIKKGAYPSISWLSFAKTNSAKIKIQEFLKKERRNKKIEYGHRILQKEFDIAGLGLIERINFKKISDILNHKFGRNFHNLDDLFIALAEGMVKSTDIIQFFKKTNNSDIQGVKANIKVLARNRFGLLRDVSEICYRHSIDMISIKAWASHKLKDAYFNVEIIVKDLSEIAHIFNELEQIDEVIAVYRIPYKKLYLSYFLIFITGLIWLSHPFILQAMINSGLMERQSYFVDVMAYFGIFSFFMMIIFITSLLKNNVPYVRNKRYLWILAFGVPVLGIMTLVAELYYFGIQRSWLVIIIEVILIYFYLVKSFWEIKKYS